MAIFVVHVEKVNCVTDRVSIKYAVFDEDGWEAS